MINQGAVEIFPPSGPAHRLSEDSRYEQPEPGTTIKVGHFLRLTG